MNKNLFTYKKSGVDIGAADKFVNFISSVSSKKKGKKKFFQIPILVVLDQFLIFQTILNNQKLLHAQMVWELKLK